MGATNCISPPEPVAPPPTVIAPSAPTAPSGGPGAPLPGEGTGDGGAIDIPEGLRTVILISIDGLASRFLEDLQRLGRTPAFSRLKTEGASTYNARAEARISFTIPNHTSMISGRPAAEVPGLPTDTHHGVTYNYDPAATTTVHDSNAALGYLASVFDEVHDRGGYTSLFSGKDKFELLHRSYSEPYARPDTIGEDDGLDKIDDFEFVWEPEEMVPAFLDALSVGVLSRPGGKNFAMLHYRNTDSDGHAFGWGSPEYLEAVLLADQLIGTVLSRIDQLPQLRDTVVIVTTDHGGVDYGHSAASDLNVYRIPFFIWGAGVPAGVDLYQLCGATRRDPGDDAPMELPTPGPIRNGDAANLALTLLGIDEIEGALHRGLFHEDGPAWCSPADAGAPKDAGQHAGSHGDASVVDASVSVRDASVVDASVSVRDASVVDLDGAAQGDAAGDDTVRIEAGATSRDAALR